MPAPSDSIALVPTSSDTIPVGSSETFAPRRGKAVLRAAPDLGCAWKIRGGAEYRSAPAWGSVFVVSVLLLMFSGCAKNKPLGPTSAPTPQENWSTQSVSVPPQGMEQRPVRQGPPPLNYLVESPAMVRIVNVTTNTELLSIPVQGRTTISLTVNGGLKVGGATMKYSTLKADDIFAIFLGNTNEDQNYIRTGTVRPGLPLTSPPPAPPGGTPRSINPGGVP